MANERLDRFTKLLKEIFELDKSDLDFGIYRVMNLRKTQIEDFLTQRLPQMVQITLAPFVQGSKEEIHAQMTQIEENAAAMGMTVDTLPDTAPMKQKYIQFQKQLTEGTDLAALETDVYSALYSFFNRYYEDGDFISKRRYKEGVYAIPYEGEEVKLYWANQDQYYIKTSENFKDYTFVFDGITVHFRLVDATTEQNNNKERKDSKRTFMLFTEDEENYPGIKTFEYNVEAAEIVIRFVYDIPEDKKKKYAEENYAAITKWLLSLRRAELNPLIAPVSTGKSKETTTRELDFFIKSEVMHLEDLDTNNETRVETYLAKVRAIKRVGKIIIDFLAQIEDFQKKLWQKKKFVVETNWCITLDKINESFWPEIIANKEQIVEWISMYAIDEAEDWSNPPTVDFLRQNQNLIVDTKYFSNTFKYALLESIPDLDKQTDGLMINGDNYQSLNLITERYRNRIPTIYIDPPYNSDASPILYKNGYKSSSWCALISDRIATSHSCLTNNGVIIVAIDDVQKTELDCILRAEFGNLLGTICVRANPSGRPMQTGYSVSHEYSLFAGASPDSTIGRMPPTDDQMKRFKQSDGIGVYEWRNLRREGSNSDRETRRGLYYPIYLSGDTIRVPEMKWNAATEVWDILEDAKPGETAVFPINDDGKEKTWRWGPEKVKKSMDLLCVRKDRTGKDFVYYKRYLHEDGVVTVSSWFDAKYSATEHGTALLKNMFGDNIFSYPKSVYLVQDSIYIGGMQKDDGICLDYFAGSGTTGHAVINLNRNDAGHRKYILVEMGEYFNAVTLPRIQKAIYASNWEDGKPQQRNNGVSQIIKYMRLESYEDALSNIQLSDDGDMMASLLGDEYLIHYMVDLESRGSLLDIEAFSDPFAYTMKITEKNECKERSIDLCETFNYLIGLTVISQSAISYFLSKPAEKPAYEGAVDLVSDTNGQYAFRQIEGTLPDGRRALVIWRTVTDDIITSNAVLDAYFTTYRKNAQDRKYDVIFVNGDSNLENLRRAGDGWKVQVTEIEFKKRMFEEA